MKNQSFNYSKTYYKVVREDDTHNGLRYRAGRVDDPVPFNNDPTASCVAGGIYFTDIENIALFFAWGEKVYPLTIPAGSPVVADPSGNKWRAPTVIMQDAISKMDAIALMPEKISGSLSLSGCTIPEGLTLPEKISGSLDLSGCTIPEGLTLPQEISGSLDLSGCTIPEGLTLPQEIGGCLYLIGCTLPEGLTLPQEIGGCLSLSGCTLPEGLTLPREIGGYLSLSGCTIPEDWNEKNLKQKYNVTM